MCRVAGPLFIGLGCALCLALILPATASQARQPRTVPRVGLLVAAAPVGAPGVPRAKVSPYLALIDELQNLGWTDGKTIVLVPRFAAGKLDRLPALAQELANMDLDLIVTMSSQALLPMAQATRSIPIVMINGSADPVGDGYAASLAHPGGNVTGVTWAPSPELLGKVMSMVKDLIPGITRYGYLNDGHVRPTTLRAWTEATQKLRIQLETFEIHDRADIEPAMAAMGRAHVDALHVSMGAATYSYRDQIATLALARRLAAVSLNRELPESGGLLSYGPNTAAQFRRGAKYVDRILRGAKPGDLPIEQPSTFELVINLKTAKAIGIKIPQSLLLQADEVIE